MTASLLKSKLSDSTTSRDCIPAEIREGRSVAPSDVLATDLMFAELLYTFWMKMS